MFFRNDFCRKRKSFVQAPDREDSLHYDSEYYICDHISESFYMDHDTKAEVGRI